MSKFIKIWCRLVVYIGGLHVLLYFIGKLKIVRRQELDYFRRNGQKEITADQKNQLNTTLDENSGI